MDDKQLVEQLKEQHVQKSDYPSEVITLPSKGLLYSSDSPLATGEIELKYPTAREEDILTSKNLITKGIVLDKFLESIIMTPGVNMDEILLGDKNGIMVASRILAYGTEYKFSLDCPRCDERTDGIEIDLAELETKDIPIEELEKKKGLNEFDFHLDASDKDIKFKLLTHGDSKKIDAEIKELKKKKFQGDKEITTRLKHAIISVDGEDNKSKIMSFVESMPTKDSYALRKEIQRITPDVDLEFYFECSNCGYEANQDVPITVSFFWPSGKL